MFWTTIAILFVLLLICYWNSRSIVHPGVVTAGIWMIVLLVYHYSNYGLYALSESFYKMVLLWAIPFCLISVFVQHTPSVVSPFIAGDANERTLKVLKPILIIALIFATMGVIYRGMQYDSSNILHGIRQASVATLLGDEESVPFPSWLKPFMELANTGALPVCLYLIIIKRDWNRYSKILFIMLIVYFVLRSNKNVLAQFGLAFACMLFLEPHISKKKILMVFVVMAALMVGLNFVRGIGVREDDFDIQRMGALYMLAPLPAFDSVIDNYSFIEDFHGEYTFRAFVKFMQIFDPTIVGNSDPFNLNNWTFTPIPVNVYTALFPFYEDFGRVGVVIFALLLGYVCGILFKHAAQGYTIGKLVYSCMFYTIIFQFFADNFFQFFWTNAAYILFCTLIVFKLNVSYDKITTV